MGDIITKIVGVIIALVFLTFFLNHGDINFDYSDKAITMAKDAYYSEEGQQTVSELKDITVDVIRTLTSGTKKLIEDSITKQERVKVSLVKVVDGDTLIVNLNGDNTTVRMIGLDTPESVNPDETKNNEYGELASAHTKELLKDIDTLYLDFDKEYEDQYGRVLAYVWLDKENTTNTNEIKERMLNGIILNDGYGVDAKYEPNTKYSVSFSMIRKDAEENNTGLWAYAGYKDLVEERNS